VFIVDFLIHVFVISFIINIKATKFFQFEIEMPDGAAG